MRADKHKIKEKRMTWIKRLILLFALLFAFSGGLVTGYYGQIINQFLSDVGEDAPKDPIVTEEQDQTIADLHPISILILGLDASEDGAPERSDTMMVATINPDEESVKLVSIPRDTLITLPNSDRIEKFNAVYPIYGINGLKEFVSDYLQIPIHFHATLSFQGLVDLVDAVGGITVDSPLAFTVQDSEENSSAIAIDKGIQRLDGERALGYARMRKQDPRGDFGRQERQREVIGALFDELLSFSSLTKVTPILNAIQPNLETNMSPQQIMSVATNYSSAARDLESIEMTGVADYVYVPSYGQELYFWIPYEETLASIQTTLREHLGLKDRNIDSSWYETIEGSPETDEEVLPEIE